MKVPSANAGMIATLSTSPPTLGEVFVLDATVLTVMMLLHGYTL